MITGPARYKPNISWATLTGHFSNNIKVGNMWAILRWASLIGPFSNNIKVIIAQMGAAAEMFAAQLYRERRR